MGQPGVGVTFFARNLRRQAGLEAGRIEPCVVYMHIRSENGCFDLFAQAMI